MSAVPAVPASTGFPVPAGTTARAAAEAAGLPLTGPEAVVVVRGADGQLRDLEWTPGADATVEPVSIGSEDGLAVLRHSAAHVLAQAVQELFPEAKLGIGPPVKDGFYYDFDVTRPFTPDDLKSLEKKMTQLINAGQRFSRREVTDDEARAELAGEPYKLELIGLKGSSATAAEGAEVEVGAGQLSMYDNLHGRTGDRIWTDLCRGPHLPTTKHIPAVKLMRTAAAYWRGSEQNPQLQRVYGTAWESKQRLTEHLEFLAEAERRDHRRIGTELDLFSFPEEIGSGLPVFHPKGGIIRRELENYSRQRHEESGYEFVNTPHITKRALFEATGHLPNYGDTMFPPMQLEGAEYFLKPMNCPFHSLVYRSRGRSYRELPLRLFEFGTVYRYEMSGVVHGLTRVRGLTMDDSHIYCTREQMAGELRSLLGFVLDLLADYGLSDFYLELSTRGEGPKFIGDPEQWEEATEVLRRAAVDSGLELVPDPGGAAFYGPKISVQARDAIGRSWQMSTVQLDFMIPQRLGLEYTAADGSRQTPVMIHRALFGSIERFFGVLTEHYAGAFPAWLAPVQVVGIPVTDEQGDYLDEIAGRLKAAGLRMDVDHSDDRMQKKIRNATTQKVPFQLIAGQTDVDAGAVSFRFRDGSQRNGVPVDAALTAIRDWVERRENASPTAETLPVEGAGLASAG